MLSLRLSRDWLQVYSVESRQVRRWLWSHNDATGLLGLLADIVLDRLRAIWIGRDITVIPLDFR